MQLGTIDQSEVAKFEQMAAQWWDPTGDAAPLHQLNPCRLDYIVQQIAAQNGRNLDAPKPLSGLRIVDVGCGGGLITEPMARLGADVVGVDAAETALAVARAHAKKSGIDVDYRCGTAEQLAQEKKRFDVVLALEIVEHVADADRFLEAIAALAASEGLIILSTINRTPSSFVKAIVGAEYVLRWLPRGTHDWRRFMKPSELSDALRRTGLNPVDTMGMVYSPLSGRWRLSSADTSANYLLTATAPA